MTYPDKTNEKPKDEKPSNLEQLKKLRSCFSWDHSKCNHPAFKGADCPLDSDCILWEER